MFRNKIAGLMLILVFSTNASYGSDWYWGAGGGIKNVSDLCSDFSPSYCEDSALSLRASGGLRINRIFAIEAAIDFSSGYKSPYLQEHSAGNFDVITAQINALLFIPVSKRVSLLAGLGPCLSNVSYDKNDVLYNTTQTAGSQNKLKHQKTDNNQVSGFFDLFDGHHHHENNNNNNNGDNGSNSSRDYSTDSNVSDTCASGLIGIETAITDKSSIRAQAQYFSLVDGGFAFSNNNNTSSFTVSFIHTF